MLVKICNSTATISMTLKQLGILRYALNIGAEKLKDSARFHKTMKSKVFQFSNETARDARKVNEALEAAVQVALKEPQC